MLDSYKGKKVKMFVSSKSGIAAKGEYVPQAFNGLIVIWGTIVDFDNDLIKLEDSQITYTDLYYESRMKGPSIVNEMAKSMILNRKYIIAILEK